MLTMNLRSCTEVEAERAWGDNAQGYAVLDFRVGPDGTRTEGFSKVCGAPIFSTAGLGESDSFVRRRYVDTSSMRLSCRVSICPKQWNSESHRASGSMSQADVRKQPQCRLSQVPKLQVRLSQGDDVLHSRLADRLSEACGL